MRLNRVVLASLIVLAFSLTAMSQTHNLNVPQQTWPAGQTFLTSTNGLSAPAGSYTMSLSPTVTGAGNDWATPGRTMHVMVEESTDGGATWLDINGNDFTTGAYGKGGSPNPPVINVGSTIVGKSTLVRVSVVCSAPITCGLTATLTTN